MGGHGGLNILPQKRWHLYREDNRARVARDEAEDRRRKAEEAAASRAAQLDAKIGRLRQRAVEAEIDEEQQRLYGRTAMIRSIASTVSSSLSSPIADDANSEHQCLSPSILCTTDPKASISASSHAASSVSPVRPRSQRVPNPHQRSKVAELSGASNASRSCRRKIEAVQNDETHSKHVNLFMEEERQFKKAEASHAKYLSEVGHETTDVSDFDRIIAQTSTPWYLQQRPSDHSTDGSREHFRVLEQPLTDTSQNVSTTSYQTTPTLSLQSTAQKDVVSKDSCLAGVRVSSRSRQRPRSECSHRSGAEEGRTKNNKRSKRKRSSSSSSSSQSCSTASDGRESQTRKPRTPKKDRRLKKAETKVERSLRKRDARDAHMAKLRQDRIERETAVRFNDAFPTRLHQQQFLV